MGCSGSAAESKPEAVPKSSFGAYSLTGEKVLGYAWGVDVSDTKGFYCVHQSSQKRYVGIKTPPTQLNKKSEGLIHLLKQLAASAREAHNLLPILELVGATEPIVVTCEMPGGDLFEHIVSGSLRTAGAANTYRLSSELLSGVAFLHTLKIIHRDVKPENILLSNTDPCKATLRLGNYSLAVSTQDGTLEYQALGTPWYAAPEVIGKQGYYSQADTWSAGITIFTMFTGSDPWHQKDPPELYNEINTCNWDRKGLNMHGYGVDDEDSRTNLHQFLSTMLCLDPRTRARAANAMQHARRLWQRYGGVAVDEENPDMSLDDEIAPQGDNVGSGIVSKGEAGTSFPSYWLNSKGSRKHKEFRTRRENCVPAFEEQLKVLLRETFKDKKTRDRKGDMPKNFKLITAHRVEDSVLWERYAAAREKVRKLRGTVTPFGDLDGDGDAETGRLRTDKALGDFNSRLDASINECYLFHGTSPEAAHSITETGFNLDKAGSSVGTMFGAGCYFAEASSKADEYSQRGAGIYSASFAMLLCRVVCGEMFRMTKSDLTAVDEALATGKYDAVLGDREASVGTYREFVVFDAAAIYPEYLLVYEHE